MADIALVTSQGLDQLGMTTGQDSFGVLVVCQQPPEHLLLQSGDPLRRHRFSPPTSRQCSLCHSHGKKSVARRRYNHEVLPRVFPLLLSPPTTSQIVLPMTHRWEVTGACVLRLS